MKVRICWTEDLNRDDLQALTGTRDYNAIARSNITRTARDAFYEARAELLQTLQKNQRERALTTEAEKLALQVAAVLDAGMIACDVEAITALAIRNALKPDDHTDAKETP